MEEINNIYKVYEINKQFEEIKNCKLKKYNRRKYRITRK